MNYYEKLKQLKVGDVVTACDKHYYAIVIEEYKDGFLKVVCFKQKSNSWETSLNWEKVEDEKQ